MFTKRFLHFLTKHTKNSNNSHQIKQLSASYEIHNLFDHSLKATNAKLSRRDNHNDRTTLPTTNHHLNIFTVFPSLKLSFSSFGEKKSQAR